MLFEQIRRALAAFAVGNAFRTRKLNALRADNTSNIRFALCEISMQPEIVASPGSFPCWRLKKEGDGLMVNTQSSGTKGLSMTHA